MVQLRWASIFVSSSRLHCSSTPHSVIRMNIHLRNRTCLLLLHVVQPLDRKLMQLVRRPATAEKTRMWTQTKANHRRPKGLWMTWKQMTRKMNMLRSNLSLSIQDLFLVHSKDLHPTNIPFSRHIHLHLNLNVADPVHAPRLRYLFRI